MDPLGRPVGPVGPVTDDTNDTNDTGMTDAEPFEAFVRRYQDMVFATAVRLLGNPADAEDVAQTVFLRAFQRFDTIGPSPGAAGWLKTVTTNACLNHLSRYRGRWRFFSELGGAPGEDAASLVPDDRPALAMERADQREELERALRLLPDHQRVPLVLFHFEDASYQDIAAALGVSLGKVKTDIHRGRETLRKLLSGTS
jgi:RNA polymerase sigma-70 factor (ECF subfamily)